MFVSLLHRSNKKMAALVAAVVWGLGTLASAQTTRGLIADNDETARFRIAVAAFEQIGRYGRSSLGERFAGRLARSLERELRGFDVLDPDAVERALRRYGLDSSGWLSLERAQRIRAALHANTLVRGYVRSASGYAQAEVISLRTGQRLGSAGVQSYNDDTLFSQVGELAWRLISYIPLEGFITDLDRYGRFEIDLGSRHGLQEGMRLTILRDEDTYYRFPREVAIGTARVLRVGSRSSEAEILDLSYGTSLRWTDRVQVERGYSYTASPYRPVPTWDPEPPYYPPPPSDLQIHAWLDYSSRPWRPGDRIRIHVRVNFDGEIFVFDHRRNSWSRADALGWSFCQAGRDVEISFLPHRDWKPESFLIRGIDARGRRVEKRLVLDPSFGPGPPPRPPQSGPPSRPSWSGPPPRPPGEEDRPGWRRDHSRLELHINKRDGASYYAGERFSVTYRVPRDCYVEVWDHRPDGKRILLERRERAEGGRLYTIKGTVTPPYGREQLVLKAHLDGRIVEERATLHVQKRR